MTDRQTDNMHASFTSTIKIDSDETVLSRFIQFAPIEITEETFTPRQISHTHKSITLFYRQLTGSKLSLARLRLDSLLCSFTLYIVAVGSN